MIVGSALVTTVDESMATNMPISKPESDCMICLCDIVPISPVWSGECTALAGLAAECGAVLVMNSRFQELFGDVDGQWFAGQGPAPAKNLDGAAWVLAQPGSLATRSSASLRTSPVNSRTSAAGQSSMRWAISEPAVPAAAARADRPSSVNRTSWAR